MKLTAAAVTPFYVVERDSEGKRVRVCTGYHLVRSYLPGSDEMFESLSHPAVFRTEAAAKKFAAKVNAPGAKFTLSAWRFGGHPCSPLAANLLAPYSVL